MLMKSISKYSQRQHLIFLRLFIQYEFDFGFVFHYIGKKIELKIDWYADSFLLGWDKTVVDT